MNIATLAFAGSDSTLGLTMVVDAIKEAFDDVNINVATHHNAKDADYLLISLYWWKDQYNLIDWLVKAGIDPRLEKPVIIIGGMAAINPRPIRKYFNYAVIGDGENVICELLRALERGEDTGNIKGVWNEKDCTISSVDKLSASMHVDVRTNKTARIEIARGCKMKCPFCELTAIKPYRELNFEIIKHLISKAPTKSIALFAPDTWSHSRMKDIEEYCRRLGKNNTGSDIRLTMVDKIPYASKIRYGVEGFSEKTRKQFGKVTSNDKLVHLMTHYMNVLKTPKGKPITMSTCYMIGDLPGENKASLQEFWDALQRVDDKLKQKHTLFLSVSSLTPAHFTPMQRCAINPYSDFNKHFTATRPRLRNIVIATRGGLVRAPQRICQMLTVRGDERVIPVMHWLATKAKKYIRSTNNADGKLLESVIAKTGFDPVYLYRELDKSEQLPWDNVSLSWE